MSEHSELGLPWVIYDSADPLHQKIKGKHPAIGGMHVADVLGVDVAAYIVLAASNHHKLVEALKTIAGGTEDTDFPFRSLPEFRMREIARDALAAFKEAGQ